MKDEATPKGSNTKSDTNTLALNSDSGKLNSMLLRFAQGKRYHRFSAESVGDHCLPTTISDLQKRHGIYFDRCRVKVKNRFGTFTPVCLYWLSGKSLLKAQHITGLDKGAA
ncbi:MAG: hypothetical protein HWE26_05020 [Alteromonadaceae bacterium]|nr:hypothetical protein [Alteromonadaceae bacterium]